MLSNYLKRLPFLVLVFFSLPAFSQTYWMQHGGGATIDEGTDVGVDASGKTYVTGYFTTAASFGSITLSSSGVDDAFVACLGTNGLYSWAVKAGGIGSDRALSIKVDAAGNSYITGFFYGSATFGSYTISSAGAQDVFIAKFDNAGVCQWAKSAGGAGADIGNGITVDNNGNVILTGEFAGTANFGSGSLTSMNGSTDVFTTKLDANGNFLWSKKGSAHLTDRGLDVDCDPSGNIYVTGQFSDTITFDVTHNNNMLNAIFVVKYDASGNEQWFRRIGGGSVNISNSIACNANGEIFLAGDFQGTITFFGSTNTTLSATYTNRIFLAKYDGSGGLTWSTAESSDSPLSVRSISANGTNCFIAGNFKCTFDSYSDRFGTGSFNSSGYWDIFEGKYDAANGAWLKCQQLGGKKDQFCNGVAVDPSGNPHLAGSYDLSLVTPVSPAFYGYFTFTNYNMTYNNDVAAQFNYCSDPYYGAYAIAPSAGNTDIFVGNPIDPARAPYDFYYHTGSGCATPFVGVCINQYNGLDYNCGPDTIDACVQAQIIAATQTSVYSPLNGIGPDFNYLWSNSQTNYYTSVSSTGYYSVTITTEDGCYTSEDTIFVNIHQPPVTPTISDNIVINNNAVITQPVVVCGDSVILTGGNYGNNTIYWTGPQFNPGADSSASVVIDSSGTYLFYSVDQYGCFSYNSVEVELDDPLPPIDPEMVCLQDSDRNDSLRFCEGTQLAFFPYDSITNPNDSTACIDNLLVVLWSITPSTGGSIFATSNCSSLVTQANITQTGWYTITELIIRQSACGNDTVSYSHSYYFEVLPSPPQGSLNVTITGNNLLCPGDSTLLVANGGTTYTWSTMDTTASIWVSLPGAYSVASADTVTNSYGCSAVYSGLATTNVTFKPQPIVSSFPADGIICPGDSVQLVSTGSGNFMWQGPNGPIGGNSSAIWVTSPGIYYCVVTDADSCQLLSNSVTLQQYNTPLLVASPSQVICPGDTVTISLTVNANSSIQWNPPLTGSSLTQLVTQPGTYSCTVQACNIPTTVSITIVPTAVTANITPLSTTTVCEGDSVLLGANAGMDSYNWQPGGDTAQTIYAYASGWYYLTTADTGGCAARDSFEVSFTPNLLTAPVVSDTTICKGLPVILTAGGTPVFYWYLSAAGGTPLATGPSYQTLAIYNDTMFYVQTDDGVCKSPMSAVYVHPDDCPDNTPNVFTPNGDGINDGWSLYRPYATGIHVWIYDRWGVLVYEYSELDGYWDGTYRVNGKQVTDGVYYYVAHVTQPTGPITGETGFIQLIREGPK